jgi:RNA recognition motif-containing protein
MFEAANATIFLSNLPYTVTDDELTDALARFGTVIGIRKITDRYLGSRVPNGVAFVEFARREEAMAALSEPSIVIGGREIAKDEARPRVARRRDTAFVSGIPPGTTKHDVLEAFGDHRAVDAYVARANGEGRRGYAFVKFASEAAQELAVRSCTHVTIGGEESVVRFAKRGFDERPTVARRRRRAVRPPVSGDAEA